jgi:hypothetical protein
MRYEYEWVEASCIKCGEAAWVREDYSDGALCPDCMTVAKEEEAARPCSYEEPSAEELAKAIRETEEDEASYEEFWAEEIGA